jgi:hypothetical protein
MTLLTEAGRDDGALTLVDIERAGLKDFVPPAFGGLDLPSLTNRHGVP